MPLTCIVGCGIHPGPQPEETPTTAHRDRGRWEKGDPTSSCREQAGTCVYTDHLTRSCKRANTSVVQAGSRADLPLSSAQLKLSMERSTQATRKGEKFPVLSGNLSSSSCFMNRGRGEPFSEQFLSSLYLYLS